MILLSHYKKEIALLCESHKVDKLYLFGSATNDSFNENSDIDFLVKFKPFDLKDYYINYLDLKEQLKKTFNREIDLVEEQTLKKTHILSDL